MKFLKIALATTALVGFASTASAQDTGAYVNLGVDAIEFDAYTASVKLGYNFTEYFGVEGQAGFGIIDEEVGNLDIGVDNTFAGFGVVRFPAGNNFEIFGRLGYHATKFGVDGAVNGDLDTDGFAAGVGGQYFFNGGQNGLRVEYTYLDIGSNQGNLGGGDVFSASYVRKF